MAYVTYTTEAIVCGTYDRNTADRSYRLFTRELGMVWADARSVRLEKSKQRMALTDFSLVRVSLVRGKGGWKVGSVAAHRNFYQQATDQAARGSVVTIIRLLRRFLQGESADPELFDFVVSALNMLIQPLQRRQFTDQIITLRILAELGYVAKPQVPAALLMPGPAELVERYSSETETLVRQLLETAEHASQL